MVGEYGRGIVQRYFVKFAAPFESTFRARMIDEDLPHQPRGDAKEMGTTLPSGQLLFNHSEIRFMKKGGWLEGLGFLFFSEIAGGEFAQFLIHERHQLIESAFIALLPIDE